ncbi:hypothetical protein GRAQ_02159 [Rahnella aquatilis CIP 78.65 = ATCC 33071]|uniref:Uncharacterized protein n=1 Tax=Rahnella aquatilis (strain ATCC 33071 / DSM 4594 / JCM 1683 / NBRC 105701 / NCIMB 13365 / CIP 78.65) TaxID=745277 RepID=H2IWE4_RAHAC|nr:hypothetical protein Rahaq2_3119 [Rahnella aquatilis CIP 78.65 = ATCC 33071]KFD04856.1 hypothetical protein GRAQ_02159 [Rahnella aquatilis CIP 78.65 = ATCC 33071]
MSPDGENSYSSYPKKVQGRQHVKRKHFLSIGSWFYIQYYSEGKIRAGKNREVFHTIFPQTVHPFSAHGPMHSHFSQVARHE